MSGNVPNRGGGFVQERAEEIGTWIRDEERAGRQAGEDEAWERIASLWPGIGTESAERILAEAMAGREREGRPSGPR